jgi:hypothetical protein
VSRVRAILRTSRDARGAVIVLVALAMPLMIGMGGLAVDVGNWFMHKRHLQVQADAGALAGAGKFRTTCVNDPILAEARKYSSVEYSGVGYTPGPGYNPQSGGTPQSRLFSEFNSRTFYNQPAPIDDEVPAGVVDNPCAAKMIDVKLTETDLPWFLRAAQVNYINAHARVEIRKKKTQRGAIPVGVPEVGPQTVRAIFVNEATGAPVASTPLKRTGTSGGLAIWSNVDLPIGVPVDTDKIGVRIVLSGSTSTTPTCGDALVDCYGAGPSTSPTPVANTPGLVRVRGYSNTPAGTATAPEARDVRLLNDTCENGYFTATATSDPCKVDVSAVVDFGATEPLDTTRVFAMRTGANTNTAVALTAPATRAEPWKGGDIAIARGEGAVSIDLRWKTGCPTDRTQPCDDPAEQGTIGAVHRAFAGREELAVSGPIKLLRLTESGSAGANSFPLSTTPQLVVTLGLRRILQEPAEGIPGVPDPIVTLKLEAGSGSLNQSLDCDPVLTNLRDELQQGCRANYIINDGQTCPSGNWRPSTPQPWNCVVTGTGAAVGQVTQGLNLRILGSNSGNPCTAPNNWVDYATPGGLSNSDPRIVSVFLTPFGAFSGAGGTTVPVTGFAEFYVTGWDGGGCQTRPNGTSPAPAGRFDDPAASGEIVGHFIQRIDTIGGEGGEEFCDFDSLEACVAVFTR